MAFAPKPNKGEEPESETNSYVIYYPHSKPTSARPPPRDYDQVVSVDPAKKNYALRVDRRYRSGIMETLVFCRFAITERAVDGSTVYDFSYRNLTNVLNSYREYYFESDFVVVERQLPINYQATRVMQHTLSYFQIVLLDAPRLPAIIEINPRVKGDVLGYRGSKNSKADLKLWAIQKALDIATQRRDAVAYSVIMTAKKKDDLADTICQVEALFKLWGKIGYLTSVVQDPLFPGQINTPIQLAIHTPIQLAIPPNPVPIIINPPSLGTSLIPPNSSLPVFKFG